MFVKKILPVALGAMVVSVGIVADTRVGSTRLHEAIEQGASLSELQRIGSDLVNEKDINGNTPLHLAVLQPKPDTGIVQWLISSGASVEAGDAEDRTALSLAAATSQGASKMAVIELLLPRVKIDTLDKKGRNAYYLAAKWGNSEVMTRLFAAGFRIPQGKIDLIGQQAQEGARYPYYWKRAAYLLGCNMLDKAGQLVDLIKADQDLMAQTKVIGGLLPEIVMGKLHALVRGYDVEQLQAISDADALHTIRTLVESGAANLEEKDQDGRTVLHLAAIMGKVEIVQELLRLGASADAQDMRGRTPLFFVVKAIPQKGQDIRSFYQERTTMAQQLIAKSTAVVADAQGFKPSDHAQFYFYGPANEKNRTKALDSFNELLVVLQNFETSMVPSKKTK